MTAAGISSRLQLRSVPYEAIVVYRKERGQQLNGQPHNLDTKQQNHDYKSIKGSRIAVYHKGLDD